MSSTVCVRHPQLSSHRSGAVEPITYGGRATGSPNTYYARAAERASSVGSPEAAESAYLLAFDLSRDEAEQATLVERAGQMASFAGFDSRAVGHFEAAVSLHGQAGRTTETARVTATLAGSLGQLGQQEQAIVLLSEALSSLEPDSAPPSVTADLHARLGAALVFSGHLLEASEPMERALTLSQHHELKEILARALNGKGILLSSMGRFEEARLNFEGALGVARRESVTRAEMVAELNLGDLCMTNDLAGAEEHLEAAMALARRWGARSVEAIAAANLIIVLTMAGRLEEARKLGEELLASGAAEVSSGNILRLQLVLLDVLCGDGDAARAHLSACEETGHSDDVQNRAEYAAAQGAVALFEGDFHLALTAGLRAVEGALQGGLQVAHDAVRLGFGDAVDAAVALSELETAERLAELLANRPPGEIPPFLRLQIERARALIAAARGGDEGVEEALGAAEVGFLELGYPYWVARTQLDLAEWLTSRGRAAEALKRAAEAAATFEDLGARPMSERARAVAAAVSNAELTSTLLTSSHRGS